MEECIFCKIIKGEIPCKKVYEDDKVLGFEDINPKAPVHVLLIPKTHKKFKWFMWRRFRYNKSYDAYG